MAKFYIALAFFVLMLGATDPWAIGVPVHEWASVLLIMPILLLHIQVDWQWVTAVSKRALKKQPGQTRFNYYWDWLLFIMITTAIVSGIVISEAVLPLFGIEMGSDPFWVVTHSNSAGLLEIMLGAHIAMHWKWLVKKVKKFRPRNTSGDPRPQPSDGSDVLSITKKSLLQMSLIVMAGSIIASAVLILGNTEWADSIRAGIGDLSRPAQDQHLLIRIVLAALYVVGKMVFAALITMGVLGTCKLWRFLAK